ncbi:8645_t:CDS:2 [Funneliformis caledonium]|uniref:8645_t:CDS:1 n=1 Tax=Funneliformis caledonium TaxID=1117310 RepID=A0A9N9I200_9GLOM|nr:8645_t:CDS:2 [Funneliformis caledonium]
MLNVLQIIIMQNNYFSTSQLTRKFNEITNPSSINASRKNLTGSVVQQIKASYYRIDLSSGLNSQVFSNVKASVKIFPKVPIYMTSIASHIIFIRSPTKQEKNLALTSRTLVKYDHCITGSVDFQHENILSDRNSMIPDEL